MKFLSAPWRWNFISTFGKQKGCLFCGDRISIEKNPLICHRGEKFFVILNKYPYSTGHLMIVPYKHMATPEEMAPEDLVEMFTLMNRSLVILRKHFHPNGFNIGMNIDKSAGAGVTDHFHLHVVPRWSGDANFMATIGDTKVLSYDLDHVHSIIRRSFET